MEKSRHATFQEAVCKKLASGFSNVTPLQQSTDQTTYPQYRVVFVEATDKS
jgi:hypothetical protein